MLLTELCKCHLVDLDEPRKVILEAMYNPNQISCDKRVPWTPEKQAQQEFDMEFTGAEPASLAVELFFDTYEQKVSVHTEYIAKLEALTQARHHPTLKEHRRIPSGASSSIWQVLPTGPSMIDALLRTQSSRTMPFPAWVHWAGSAIVPPAIGAFCSVIVGRKPWVVFFAAKTSGG